MKSNRMLLFFILLLAAGLRFYHLGQESLWFDEGWTVRVTNLNAAGLVADAAADVHPPLYYFFMKGWVKLFAASEWVIRVPSVLFGLGAVYGLYLLGRAMLGESAGLLAAFLLSISVFHVRYSQEARSYSLLAMLVIFSTWGYWKFLFPNAKPSNAECGMRNAEMDNSSFRIFEWRSALAYLIPTVLLMFVHNFALLVLLAQWAFIAGLWLFSKEERQPRRLVAWLGLQAVLGLVYLPWIGILMRQVHKIRQGFWIPPMTLKSLSYSFIEYAGSWWLLWIFVPLAVWGFIKCGMRNAECGMNTGSADVSSANPSSTRLPSSPLHIIPHSPFRIPHFLDRSALPQLLFLLLMVLIPNVVPYIVSRLMAPMYTTKSTIFCAPMLYLLAAWGIVKLRPWGVRAGVIALLAVLCLGAVHAEDVRVRKETWRTAVSELEAVAEPGDLLLFNWGDCLDNAYYYYSHRTDLVKQYFPTGGWTIDESSMPELEGLLKGRDRLWVILCRAKDTKGLLMKRVRAGYTERFHKIYRGYDEYIDIYRFER